MGHTWKNVSHREKMGVTLGEKIILGKKGSQLKKNGSHFKSHFKKWSLLGKWVKLGKKLHTRENGSHLELKESHLEKSGPATLPTWKTGTTWKNESHFEKWVKQGKMGHTWKNCSHLEKLVTLKKMGHI